MKMKRVSSLSLVALFLSLTFVFSSSLSAALAEDSSGSALGGLVSSQEEGMMEGVLVSAKRAGSTIATTVVTDSQGHHSFPRNRLELGQYTMRIRAIGYELPAPTTVDVASGKPAQLDLKLRKTQDLARQLSNGEWLKSMTGTDEQKQAFL